jgi:hypothetical protein
VLPYITNYLFCCKDCSENNEEKFERGVAGWKEIAVTAIANLIISPENSKKLFTKKDDIIPFIESNWKALCTGRSRTPTWWATGKANKNILQDERSSVDASYSRISVVLS